MPGAGSKVKLTEGLCKSDLTSHAVLQQLKLQTGVRHCLLHGWSSLLHGMPERREKSSPPQWVKERDSWCHRSSAHCRGSGRQPGKDWLHAGTWGATSLSTTTAAKQGWGRDLPSGLACISEWNFPAAREERKEILFSYKRIPCLYPVYSMWLRW